MTWEMVSESANEVMDRTSVAGGWIYRLRTRSGSEHTGFTWSVAICFVPTAP